MADAAYVKLNMHNISWLTDQLRWSPYTRIKFSVLVVWPDCGAGATLLLARSILGEASQRLSSRLRPSTRVKRQLQLPVSKTQSWSISTAPGRNVTYKLVEELQSVGRKLTYQRTNMHVSNWFYFFPKRFCLLFPVVNVTVYHRPIRVWKS